MSETGEPITPMTKLEYTITWAIAMALGLALARYFLVNPILEALPK